jgi:hypothetical protein
MTSSDKFCFQLGCSKKKYAARESHAVGSYFSEMMEHVYDCQLWLLFFHGVLI